MMGMMQVCQLLAAARFSVSHDALNNFWVENQIEPLIITKSLIDRCGWE